MALINCPECDHRVSESAPACPNCGFEIKAHVKAQQIAQEAEKKRTRTKRGCFGCAGLLILGFFGMALLGSLIPVEDPNNSTSSTGEPEAAQQSVEQDALTTTKNSEVVVAAQSGMPALDTNDYQVLRDELEEGTKRTVEIRLSDKLTQLELQLLARKIEANTSADVPKTFISYYLPGMEIGRGAWATSHFDPDLQIEILGPAKGEVENAPRVGDDEKRLGRWIDNGPAGGTFIIYEDAGNYFAERHFRDGSDIKQELVRKPSSSGQHFEVKDSSHGAYYLIDEKGNLRIGDQDGLIKTLRK